jgi:hypothetical protein
MKIGERAGHCAGEWPRRRHPRARPIAGSPPPVIPPPRAHTILITAPPRSATPMPGPSVASLPSRGPPVSKTWNGRAHNKTATKRLLRLDAARALLARQHAAHRSSSPLTSSKSDRGGRRGHFQNMGGVDVGPAETRFWPVRHLAGPRSARVARAVRGRALAPEVWFRTTPRGMWRLAIREQPRRRLARC